MKENVMDIIERFQMHHALQEASEMENSHASGNGATAPSGPNNHENSIFEAAEVRVSTVAVPRDTEWSPPHDGRDRLVVPLDKIGQPLPRDPAFPARGTWIPANSNFKVPNKAHQTRTLLIVEFHEVEGLTRKPGE